MAEEVSKTPDLESMEDWRLWRGKSDPTVLLAARDKVKADGFNAEDSRKIEARRLALDAFEIYPEDLTENYERVY